MAKMVNQGHVLSTPGIDPGPPRRRLTLSFLDEGTERAFREDYFWSNLAHGRFSHVIAGAFLLGYGLIEWLYLPQIGADLLLPRAVTASIWVVGLLFSYLAVPLYRRSWQPLFAFYVVWAGTAQFVMMRVVGPESAGLLFPALALTLFFGFAFIRLRFLYATLSGAIVVLAYPLTTLGWPGEIRWEVGSDFSYLVGFGVVGALTAYRLEQLARRDFLRRNELAQVGEALTVTNDSLEELVEERTRALAASHGEMEGKIRDLEASREESRELQDQLGQARKLEAVGHLAGGVAHDFNNLLTVINANAELALGTGAGDTRIKGNLKGILEAGHRAADLTRQLLAFSRKQVLEPEVLDLNEVVRQLLKMLERLIPEDIRIETDLCPHLPPVLVDRGQMEQVILNLAVNARDAMPDGGTLTLETSLVELDGQFVDFHTGSRPGAHVQLSLRDTGIGMDEDTVDRIFDPFFTTKEIGKGTGLGLSTVFGIVLQSGGNIWVDSEEECGTTFTVHLPSAPAEDQDEVTEGPLGSEVMGGSELVLVVEDDKAVRGITEMILLSLGYRVILAASGPEGIEKAREVGNGLDLLLTDVVLPGMSGLEVAQKLRQERPDLRVLFMSGYPSDVIVHKGVLDPGLHLLHKPFTREVLASQVRQTMAAPPSPFAIAESDGKAAGEAS